MKMRTLAAVALLMVSATAVHGQGLPLPEPEPPPVRDILGNIIGGGGSQTASAHQGVQNNVRVRVARRAVINAPIYVYASTGRVTQRRVLFRRIGARRRSTLTFNYR